jgi:hypothetical protein
VILITYSRWSVKTMFYVGDPDVTWGFTCPSPQQQSFFQPFIKYPSSWMVHIWSEHFTPNQEDESSKPLCGHELSDLITYSSRPIGYSLL